MKQINAFKKFKTSRDGAPDLSLIELQEPATVAVSAEGIPYIRPKLLVKEKDPVKTGTPVFCDKRNPEIQYVSPGTGTVKHIVFGPRRKLVEVIITLDKKEDFIEFGSIDPAAAEKADRKQIVQKLCQGGLWQCFREFPAGDTAACDHSPPMIIVSLNGNDIFSPHPGVALKDRVAHLAAGIALLRIFSPKIVVTARKSSLDQLNGLSPLVTHLVTDDFPAWDPGVVLYSLKSSVEENRSWHITAEHLALISQFLSTGLYPVKRVITVSRTSDKKPHMRIRQGTPIEDIIGTTEDSCVITTGMFNGRSVRIKNHAGFFDNHFNILQDAPDDELFGFVRPGIFKPTASKTFLSSIIPVKPRFDCTLHGEERACINCGYCARICPVELMPNFIMKALHSDDIEDALNLGLWDCVRCGLCSYVCPSKIELTQILSRGIDAYYKDKQ